MAGIGLEPRRRGRPEQVDPVVVTRRRRDVLVIERGCHVEHFLAQALECLRMPASLCLPRLDNAVTASRVKSRSVAIESQAGGLRRVCASAPLDGRRHQARLVRGAKILRLDNLSKLRLFLGHLALNLLSHLYKSKPKELMMWTQISGLLTSELILPDRQSFIICARLSFISMICFTYS